MPFYKFYIGFSTGFYNGFYHCSDLVVGSTALSRVCRQRTAEPTVDEPLPPLVERTGQQQRHHQHCYHHRSRPPPAPNPKANGRAPCTGAIRTAALPPPTLIQTQAPRQQPCQHVRMYKHRISTTVSTAMSTLFEVHE